jgi:thiamine biosynthesis lipoprotein
MTTTMTPRSVFVEEVMGTVVSLDVRDGEPPPGAIEACFGWLRAVDERFSPYRADSEVSRFGRGELEPTGDARWVLERCEALRRETDGAFDAWATGRYDPSALVKGWAVQRAADGLATAGVRTFCLSAGGDVAVRGGADPWRIGIQHPDDRSAIAAVLAVPGGTAVATSGAYERGEHIVDPRSGRAPRGVLSVTVVGPDLGTADAYATAAFAMGADGPPWTATLKPYEAMTILADRTVLYTSGFPAV